MIGAEETRQIFLEAGALLKGHFRLSSGRHSGEYWEKFWVLQWPRHVETLCGEIARRYQDAGVDVVLGPTTGGILLAFEVARQMGVRAIYAEKEGGERTLRRGLALEPGTRTLIVDDVLTMGGSVRECLDLAARHGAEVVGVAVLVDRSGGTVDLGCRLESLLEVQAETYAPEECPLCAQNIPVREPGTRFLNPTT
ncbi:MAG TPA: orotate phosphoribosyltransferase [Chthonomonadaceae bacterium]|nr:orotate phosphoribosyltransferase [Chthonomonadaceae bacterium]